MTLRRLLPRSLFPTRHLRSAQQQAPAHTAQSPHHTRAAGAARATAIAALALLCLPLPTWAQRVYDSSGSSLARIEGERVYNASGQTIGRVDGQRIYDSSGRLLGRIDGAGDYPRQAAGLAAGSAALAGA